MNENLNLFLDLSHSGVNVAVAGTGVAVWQLNLTRTVFPLAVAGMNDAMNASEVSQVLVSLSGAGVMEGESGGVPFPAATDTIIATATG